jgi:hypothetical protein
LAHLLAAAPTLSSLRPSPPLVAAVSPYSSLPTGSLPFLSLSPRVLSPRRAAARPRPALPTEQRPEPRDPAPSRAQARNPGSRTEPTASPFLDARSQEQPRQPRPDARATPSARRPVRPANRRAPAEQRPSLRPGPRHGPEPTRHLHRAPAPSVRSFANGVQCFCFPSPITPSRHQWRLEVMVDISSSPSSVRSPSSL